MVKTKRPNRLRATISGACRTGCLLVAVAVSSCADPAPPSTRIVLITLDTLRLDSFSGSDTRASAMPKTLAFARKGRIFANHFSATPTTQPSHASLLTGLHPWEHGVIKNGLVLGPERSTVAEVLVARGYSTDAVVASFPLHRQFGFGQGFESYDDQFSLDIGGRQWAGRRLGGQHFYSLAKRVTDQAIERLDLAEGPLQFFWFHYFDSHDPYGDTGDSVVELGDVLALVGKRSPGLSLLLERAREGYDRDNAFLDNQLDRLFRRLADDSEQFETHIVLASDHGEGFGEAGVFGHDSKATPEVIHVPLFIVSPKVESGIDTAATGSVDVAATLIALAGVGEPFGNGRDLTKSGAAGGFEGTKAPARVVGLAASPRNRRPKPRSGGEWRSRTSLRFYVAHEGDLITGHSRELRPEPEDPQLAREIRSLFESFENAYQPGAVELTDPQTRKALEALGYVE